MTAIRFDRLVDIVVFPILLRIPLLQARVLLFHRLFAFGHSPIFVGKIKKNVPFTNRADWIAIQAGGKRYAGQGPQDRLLLRAANKG